MDVRSDEYIENTELLNSACENCASSHSVSIIFTKQSFITFLVNLHDQLNTN